MNFITCHRGARRGFWFKTEADLAAFRGHPDVRDATAAEAPSLLGFPCRVATAEEWADLEAGVAHESALRAQVAKGRAR